MNKLFTNVLAKIKRLSYGDRLMPLRDWMIILVVAAVFLLGSIVWNIWLFLAVANGEILGTTPSVKSAGFNHASVEDVQTIFVKRVAEDAKYMDGTYRFVDPSQ